VHGDGAVARDREHRARLVDGGGGGWPDPTGTGDGEVDGEADARGRGALQEVPSIQLGAHRYTSPAAARLIARLMRRYVAQRQMLPVIAVTMSASLGFGLLARSAAACMIWPD